MNRIPLSHVLLTAACLLALLLSPLAAGVGLAQTTYAPAVYTANGTQTAFSIPFSYAQPQDLVVTVNGAVSTGWTLTTSSTVTFATAPAANAVVIVARSTSLAQPATTFAGGALSSIALNDQTTQLLDGLQETQYDLTGAIRAAPGQTLAALPYTPTASIANTAIVFDANGNPQYEPLPVASSANASSVTYTNPATGGVQVSQASVNTRKIALLDFIPTAQLAAIANYTSTYDETAALSNATGACPVGSGCEIDLPIGRLYFATTLALPTDRPVRIVGQGPGAVGTDSGTELKFAAGVSSGVHLMNGSGGMGANSTLEALKISGSDTGACACDGILDQANETHITQVVVQGFGGNGYHGDDSTGGDSTNNDDSRIDDLKCYDNYGDCVKNEGSNANAKTFTGLLAFGGTWVVEDSSAIGNWYMGITDEGASSGTFHIPTGGGNDQVYGVFAEPTGHNVVQIDTGGQGNNVIFLGNVGSNPIVNNDNSGIGDLILNAYGYQHFLHMQWGSVNDTSYITSDGKIGSTPATTNFEGGAQAIFSDNPLTTHITVAAVSGCLSMKNGAPYGFTSCALYNQQSYTNVAGLPACTGALIGSSGFVNDSTATTFDAIVAGGSSAFVPVFCDGTNWRIG